MSIETIRIFVGFDQREAIAYHAFCQSVIEKASQPVEFIPLARNLLDDFDGQQDGTNAFIFSRYLIPYLCNFQGWALFFDGDMICTGDVANLWNDRERLYDKAVSVVKHDYVTKSRRKYIGSNIENDNVDYPRKNWSSVMLWNCSHYANRQLTPEAVANKGAVFLHRFQWLDDKYIGELMPTWNHLVGENPPGPANLYHQTLGVPFIKHYADDFASWHAHRTLVNMLECAGEDPVDLVLRSTQRAGN